MTVTKCHLLKPMKYKIGQRLQYVCGISNADSFTNGLIWTTCSKCIRLSDKKVVGD